ncbi:MAG: DUF2807 domain-containing protein [Saprospiraceae bacterium]|nr:DUF2807 domain-containing protein [Saprospiraceae bacterium]
MKNIITNSIYLAFLFLSVSSFGQTRDVGQFHGVSISTSIEATLVHSNSTKVEYTMKKGEDKNLVTKVKNGILYVKTKSGIGNWGNSTSAKVTVYYTNLDEINVSAGCTVKTDGEVSAKTMDVEVTSGSTAILEIDANEIDVEVTSGATLKLSGEANQGEFEATSGSTLNGYNFVTNDADVEASSGASLFIHVNDTLNAEASSGASIRYTGDVKKKNIDAGWSGSIKRKG